jgi:hypothetical protein
MIFYATNFYGSDVDWLAYNYWSERANEPLENPSNFMNATYDSYRDDLLGGTTYAEVYAAAAEMQKILHYNVPLLIVYENIYMQAYRNDVYEGHVDTLDDTLQGHGQHGKSTRLMERMEELSPSQLVRNPTVSTSSLRALPTQLQS